MTKKIAEHGTCSGHGFHYNYLHAHLRPLLLSRHDSLMSCALNQGQ
jgi:hypothetical protein